MLACRILGHRHRFWSDGPVMHWRCARGCGECGTKTYASPAEASRFAAAFDREDRDELGRRAPFVGLLPLRVWYRFKNRHDRHRRNRHR